MTGIAGGEPLVSVIIPCRDGAASLPRTLDSLARQTHPAIELVFVDNNSTDASVAIARGFVAPNIVRRIVTSCAAPGVNHARNHGYAQATGAFIQWLDADDELEPEKIARQVAALADAAGADIAHGDWVERRTEPGRPPWLREHPVRPAADQLTRILGGVWYPTHAHLLRRAAADRLAGMQAWWPDRRVATDVEYFAIAALLGMRFLYVPHARAIYNVWSSGQISSSTPYPVRLASLAAIYHRVADIAARPAARTSLNARQRRLLAQGWTIWHLPPESVALTQDGPRRLRLHRRDGGAMMSLGPREAHAVHVLMDAGLHRAISHHAVMLAEAVPDYAGDHVAIVALLERLAAAGFLIEESRDEA